MKIEQTTLSMDAFSSHKEMTTEGSQSAGVTEWQSFLDESSLKNSLTIESEVPQKTTEVATASGEAQTTGTDDDAASKAIISRITNSLVGENTHVAEFQRQQTGRAGDAGDGFTLNVAHTHVSESTDTMQFNSTGAVQTADGRSINFNMGLSVEKSVSTSAAWCDSYFLDPITLSFDDGLDALSGGTFSFDLTGDGNAENIASLSKGSGFLVLDANNDGVVNDGTELFGPQSGSGYGELSKYDSDGNMWIDENDPIFDELKVWKGAGTEDAELISLREAGVGALSLASVSTDFEMKDSSGQSLGQVSRAGLFLMENGEPRSMQEIDLNTKVGEEQEEGNAFGINLSGLTTGESEEELSPLQQAIVDAIERLKAILEQQEQKGQQQVRQILFHEEKSETLVEKFWSWQAE